MVAVFFILLLGVAIALIELPTLLKKHSKKDIVIFFVLLIFSISISIAYSLGIKLPNPAELYGILLKPLADVLNSIFKFIE